MGCATDSGPVRLAVGVRRWWTSERVTESTDQPIIPDYGGANVRGIVPALLGPGSWSSSMPDWMPAPVASADQAVLLVLDGLGWDQLQERRQVAPDDRRAGGWTDHDGRADARPRRR